MAFDDTNKTLRSCDCGSIVVVPNGHTALDGDDPVRCHECDKPTGVKVYQALSWRHN